MDDFSRTIHRLLNDKGGAIATIAPEAPVAEAAKMMAAAHIGVLVCQQGDAILGVISERDIVRACDERGGDLVDLRVAEIMTADVRTCGPDLEINEAMRMMRMGGFRHLPVVEDGALIGLISATDILMFYMRHASLTDRRAVLDIILDAGLVYPGG